MLIFLRYLKSSSILCDIYKYNKQFFTLKFIFNIQYLQISQESYQNIIIINVMVN